MRGRVDVLPQNQPVPEREDVDAVPLLLAGRRRPLADREVVAGVEGARRETQRRVVAENLGDVIPDGRGALGALVFVLLNLLVDIAYLFLDPRISYS